MVFHIHKSQRFPTVSTQKTGLDSTRGRDHSTLRRRWLVPLGVYGRMVQQLFGQSKEPRYHSLYPAVACHRLLKLMGDGLDISGLEISTSQFFGFAFDIFDNLQLEPSIFSIFCCFLLTCNLPQNPWRFRYESDLADKMNRDTASPVTLTFSDGRTLRTRDHGYPLDDVYCFVNGWYKSPDHPDRRALMNFSYLEEVSDKACSHLEKILPEYHSLSASNLSHESTIDEATLAVAVATSGLVHVPDMVVRGMIVHAAVKCVMRGACKY